MKTDRLAYLVGEDRDGSVSDSWLNNSVVTSNDVIGVRSSASFLTVDDGDDDQHQNIIV